jgi:uncharacterized protein YbjT (DUF2867 family)
MSNLKVFAVAGGTGASPIALGPFIVEGLILAGATVKVLARKGSTNSPGAEKLKTLGAKIVEVDYQDVLSMQQALKGVDVVVSVLGGAGIAAQVPLAEAAVKAGVKLFVPSEFGNPSVHPDNTDRDVNTMGPIAPKVKMHQTLKKLELPYVLIFNGIFADAVKVFWVTGEKKASVVGDGNNELSWTSRRDIGEFVGKALTTVPLEKLSNATLRIEGSRCTFNDLFSKAGYQISYESVQDAYKRWETTGEVLAWLKAQVGEGWALVSPDKSKLDNGLVPDWKPKHVAEFL